MESRSTFWRRRRLAGILCVVAGVAAGASWMPPDGASAAPRPLTVFCMGLVRAGGCSGDPLRTTCPATRYCGAGRVRPYSRVGYVAATRSDLNPPVVLSEEWGSPVGPAGPTGGVTPLGDYTRGWSTPCSGDADPASCERLDYIASQVSQLHEIYRAVGWGLGLLLVGLFLPLFVRVFGRAGA